MNRDIVQLNVTIGSVSEQLLEIEQKLETIKRKQERREAWDDAGLAFVEKAEKIITKAETGEIVLTSDQIQRIASNLLKIQEKLVFRKNS